MVEALVDPEVMEEETVVEALAEGETDTVVEALVDAEVSVEGEVIAGEACVNTAQPCTQ